MRTVRWIALAGLVSCGAPAGDGLEAGNGSLGYVPDPAKQAVAPYGVPLMLGRAALDTTPTAMTFRAGRVGVQYALGAADRFDATITPGLAPRIPFDEFVRRTKVELFAWTGRTWQPTPMRGNALRFELGAPADGVYLVVLDLPDLARFTMTCTGANSYGLCGSCNDDARRCQQIDRGSTLQCGRVREHAIDSCLYLDGLDDPFHFAPAPGSNLLEGQLHRNDGGPIAGLRVGFGTHFTATDARGHYLLGGLPPGTLLVDVTWSPFDPVHPPVALSGEDTATYRVRLDRPRTQRDFTRGVGSFESREDAANDSEGYDDGGYRDGYGDGSAGYGGYGDGGYGDGDGGYDDDGYGGDDDDDDPYANDGDCQDPYGNPC